MSILNEFVEILSGEFDNSEQYEIMKEKGVENFPFAEHINTVCNDKIVGLPENFEGLFLVEESYYTVNGKTNNSPHLFLFTEENGEAKLTSYEVPEPYDKTNFTYKQIETINYEDLKLSEKFTPAIYKLNNGVWEGGSVSMFSPVVKFTLFERFSKEQLEVSEKIEVNGKKTFGYDEAIIYKRK